MKKVTKFILLLLLPAAHTFLNVHKLNNDHQLLHRNKQLSFSQYYEISDVDGFDTSHQTTEQQTLELLAQQINTQLDGNTNNSVTTIHATYPTNHPAFADLACEPENTVILADMLTCLDEKQYDLGVKMLQSLCVLGMQVSVKGPPQVQERQVQHLIDSTSPSQQLKYLRDTKLGVALLKTLRKKQTAQGAFDLLVKLGIWSIHEDLALLRSGFPVTFEEDELKAAEDAITDNRTDPDKELGLRKDLRAMKVYTIDNPSAREIDDGLSIEVLTDKTNGDVRQRIWIHIADAEYWAPRGSDLLKVAQRRATSIYLPTKHYPMFPNNISIGHMSLRTDRDSKALSLGVELLPCGAIDESSIVMTTSLVSVTYRLTYDDVDEMLEEGSAFREEWQLGALSTAAKKRRQYRINNGSTEQIIPNPIPSTSVNVKPCNEQNEKEGGLLSADDEWDINVKLEVSHNAGMNSTAVNSLDSSSTFVQENCEASSAANLLVTEMMILAGEAIGKWAQNLELNAGEKYVLPLPYRTQASPDFISRELEHNTLRNMQETNVGGGYCAAWYVRRFLEPVKIVTESENPGKHSGLGLDCYVQWSSPIRRLSDLQVHAAVKRHLRRVRVKELLDSGEKVPSCVKSLDIGYDLSDLKHDRNSPLVFQKEKEIDSIDFKVGAGMARAQRPLQRASDSYWLFEYLRRQKATSGPMSFKCLVLGCVNFERLQYAIYIYDIGLEWRYLSEKGELFPGDIIWLSVHSVNPRQGLMKMQLASNNSARTNVAAAA